MTLQFETSALAHRIAVLDEIGAGPLWVRRDALLEMAVSSTAEVEVEVEIAAAVAVSIAPPVADAQSGDAAWDDPLEVAQVRRYIQREAVGSNPAAEVNA